MSEQRDPEVPAREGDKAVDDMERKAERLRGEIDETRTDWEAKKGDASVPGAQPDEEDRDEEGPPEEADVTPGD